MKTTSKFKGAPETIKYPLQSKTKGNRPVFVYIRRSTRNKQELSIQRQEDNARETIEEAGYNPEEVEYYIESMTAYNGVRIRNGAVIRQRVEFTRMLRDIDKSPVPVIILTYEHSRLSRNTIDSGEILKRLFHKYDKSGGTIEKIVFNGGETWDITNRYSDIEGYLAKALAEGETISIRTKKATLRQLRKGRYILGTPIGIRRLKKGEDKLQTTEEIEAIKKAWEMRANRKSKNEIQKFLDRHGIKLNVSFEQFFQTLIYTGYWQDPETGELIPQQFEGGKAPIPWEIWEKVQSTLIRNNGKIAQSKYGKKQEGDVLSQLMRWEHDASKAFSVEFPKGKYRSYKSNAHGGYNKSEIKILETFIRSISPIIEEGYKSILRTLIEEEEKRIAQSKLPVGNWETSLVKQQLQRSGISISFEDFASYLRDSGELERVIEKTQEELSKEFDEKGSELLTKYFKNIADEKGRLDDDRDGRDKAKERLGREIEKKEQDKKTIQKNALLHGFSADVASEAIQDIQQDIERMQSEINKLSESTDIEQYFERLPEVLGKTLELSSKVLYNEDIEGMRDDILKLVEITTLELSISTKKELKVKLFEGLENVLKGKDCIWLPK